MTEQTKPLALGTQVKPYYARVVMVGMIDGERYYWLANRRGDVSMMPAEVVECVARMGGRDERNALMP